MDGKESAGTSDGKCNSTPLSDQLGKEPKLEVIMF